MVLLSKHQSGSFLSLHSALYTIHQRSLTFHQLLTPLVMFSRQANCLYVHCTRSKAFSKLDANLKIGMQVSDFLFAQCNIEILQIAKCTE